MPYFADFTHREDGILRLVRGDSSNTVSIAVRSDRMLVVLEGEPDVRTIVECLQSGLDQGWLRLSMRTLVDLRRFFGVVDWGALKGLEDLAAWASDGRESRAAYLVRNDAFHFIIRAIAGLFLHTRHKVFTSREAAVAWLNA